MSSLASPFSCGGWYKCLHDLNLPQSPTLLTLLIIRAMIHGYVMKIEYDAKGPWECHEASHSHHSVRVPSFIARWEGTGDESGCMISSLLSGLSHIVYVGSSWVVGLKLTCQELFQAGVLTTFF